jgi:cellobiose phosphorylase
MYRVGLEAILGFRKRGDSLRIEPRVPASWGAIAIEYRHGGTIYRIEVREPARVSADCVVTLDGRRLPGPDIPLADDGGTHEVVVAPR